MPTFPYPNQRYSTNLGLSLFGMDEVLADNMNLIDAAYGAGSSINVNGTLVTSPNFNGTTPAAPGGDTNVTFQVDSNGNVSAYVPTGAASVAWSSITNPTGNLVLSMAGYTSIFNYTSAVSSAFSWLNTTASTSSIPQSSPVVSLGGTLYDTSAAASANDAWTLQDQTSNPLVRTGHTNIVSITESASSVVTIGIAYTSTAAAFRTAGTEVYLSGFPSGFGDWLNGKTVLLTTASAVSLTFADPTNHGTLATHNFTAGQDVTITQIGGSNLVLSNAGAGVHGGGLMLVNPNAGTSTVNQDSPLLSFVGNGASAGVSSQDLWTLGTILSGTGISTSCIMKLNHLSQGDLFIGEFAIDDQAGVPRFSIMYGGVRLFQIAGSVASNGAVSLTALSRKLDISGTSVNLNCSTITTSTPGVFIGGEGNPITFAPATGAVNGTSVEILSACAQTGSATGNFTGTLINSTGNQTGFLGTTFLTVDFQNDNGSVFQVGQTGAIFPAGGGSNGTLTDNTGSTGTANQVLTAGSGNGVVWATPSTGFTNPMTTLGDIIYENATPAAARLAGNTTTTKEYLSQTGNGTISAAPAWSQVAIGDLANIAAGTVVGNPTGSATTPSATIAPVLGIPGTSTGTIALASSTASGKFTITAPASAATPTLTLSTSSGVVVNVADGTVFTATIAANGTLALATQTANTVFSGPSSAGPSAPTFRALVAADIPNTTITPIWNNLQNATGALTLANGTNATTFNQTSNVIWLWANTTTATSGTTNASPLHELAANYWTGAASATDTWAIGSSLAAGTNGASTLAITQSGSTGIAKVTVPRLQTTSAGTVASPSLSWGGTAGLYGGGGANQVGIIANGAETVRINSNVVISVVPYTFISAIGNSPDGGISRLGAASLAIGNGTAGDFTGSLKLTTLTLQGKIGTYNAIATVSNGVPSELAVSDLTAQSAAITATTLYATTATGMYRISWSATITTVDGVSSVLGGAGGFQVIYTSPTDSVVKTTVAGNSVTSAANTTGTAVGGCEVVYAKTGTNIQFTYGYTSATPGQMIYELHIKVEAM